MTFSPDHPAGVGLIGAGNIARRYAEGMSRFPQLRLVGVADLAQPLADALAAEHGVIAYPSLEALLSDPAVDLVVNITPPNAHAAVTVQALRAGKHVYVEKPMAAVFADSANMRDAADAAGLRLGSAPDTFLGSAGQTARAALDAGAIGTPIAASAFIVSSAPETWHPNPTFLFQPGGGPVLDLGPYYITSLVNLLGPVADVAGFTRIGSTRIEVTAPGRTVDSIEVTTPTHATAALRFDNGVLGTVMMSFDVWDAGLPRIEVYGTEGTLSLPDPNEFDGPVRVKRHGDDDWTELAPVFEPSGEPATPSQLLRGVGVADLAAAVDGRPHRASGELAQHVLEVLEAIQRSSDSRTVIDVTTRAQRPAPRDLTL